MVHGICANREKKLTSTEKIHAHSYTQRSHNYQKENERTIA